MLEFVVVINLKEHYFWKAYLPKASILGQIVSEMLVPVCPDDSIQILSSKIDLVPNVMNWVKFRWICMESLEHNWANISETICPEKLVFDK